MTRENVNLKHHRNHHHQQSSTINHHCCQGTQLSTTPQGTLDSDAAYDADIEHLKLESVGFSPLSPPLSPNHTLFTSGYEPATTASDKDAMDPCTLSPIKCVDPPLFETAADAQKMDKERYEDDHRTGNV
eukprot:5570712-Amphidinium_carterae.1